MDNMGQSSTGMGTSTQSRIGSAMARAVLRVENYPRARKFYSETLGLKVQDIGSPGDMGGMGNGIVWMNDGQTAFEIYERPGMPAPQNTTLGFEVDPNEFDRTVEDLRSRGVHFEEYNIPEINLMTTNGVAEIGGSKVAWFLDTEGNILSVGSSDQIKSGRM